MDHPTDLADWRAVDLVEAFRARSVSPVEALDAAHARVRAKEDKLNAFVLLCGEEARRTARDSEARWGRAEPLGPLDGVPVSIKDLNWMRGYPTRRGSLTLEDVEPDVSDSPAVARLRESGAVIVGKTTTPEFGWKGVTDSPLTGITRNPYDPERTPGGSSGGAAVSVATGMCALALGGDGAGSIRIPAAFTGVFGIKPSAYSVPYYPQSPLGTLSQVGPLARTVADAAHMLTVIGRPDARDPFAKPLIPPPADDAPVEPATLRLLYSDFGHPALSTGVRTAVETALARLEQRGAAIDRRERLFDDPRAWFEELYAAGQADLLRRLPPEQRERLDPGFRALAERGLEVDLRRYLDLQRRKHELAREVTEGLAGYDLIVTPQLPIPAFAAGQDVPPDSGMASWLDWSPYTYPFNLTGHPAATVTCGTSEGLPVALQLVAPHYADWRLLGICKMVESVMRAAG